MTRPEDKTKEIPGAEAEDQPIPLATQMAVYATGTFGNTINNVVTVVIPLWALHLGASPVMIGLIVGARHFLTTIFSIHGGALMDRLGTRRVLIWFATIGAVTPFMFPLMPWLWAVVFLQMIDGLSSSFAWMGAQAQVGQLMRGNPKYAGRLSFTVRFGHLVAPLAAGGAWDLFGPWGGFAVLGTWAIGVLISANALPRPEGTGPQIRLKPADVVPRLADYMEALRMLAIPAIALVVMASTLRMSGQGMHTSFYVVYLEGIELQATLIGALLSVGSLVGFAGALSVAPLARRCPPHWLLLGAVLGGALSVAATPLLGGIFLLLLGFSGLRGGAMALAQPLMISILSKSAGRNQAKGVGIRTTANRLVSFVVPVIMGGVVELVGLEMSFLVVGAVLTGFALFIAVFIRRTPDFQPGFKPGD
jgi:MFS family permease